MAQDSYKVIVPGNGRYFTGPVDSAPPGQIVGFTGAPTAVTSLVLTVGGVSTSGVALPTLTAADQAKNCLIIAQALAGLSSVGSGNVYVFPGPTAVTFLVIIDPEVVTQVITSTGSTFTGGTGPAVAISSRATWTAGPYTEVGHTSIDNPMQENRTGGDVTTYDTWQASGVESSTAPVTKAVAFSLHQYDVANMKLYYGANSAVDATDGSILEPQGSASATQAALFLLVFNGSKAMTRWFPRTSIIAADAESFDTTKLAEMPVAATILASSTLAYSAKRGVVGAYA